MKRIVIVGGGYAGIMAANRLSRMARGLAEVALVTARAHFVERIRLHEWAARPDRRTLRAPRAIRSLLDDGVELVVGTVSELDAAACRLTLVESATTVAFDEVVLTTGSDGPLESPPGVHSIAGEASASSLRAALVPESSRAASVAVVGGGATGIELACELASYRPDLRVSLVSKELGASLSPSARAAVRSRFDQLGISLHLEAATALEAHSVTLASSHTVTADRVVWCGGFSCSPLATRAGIAVDGDGRVRVGPGLRSVSHPHVFAAGDAARVEIAGPDGAPQVLRMACATALPMGAFVAEEVARSLRDEPLRHPSFAYAGQCLSLGKGAGVVDRHDAFDRPTRLLAGGIGGAWLKEAVSRYAFQAMNLERIGVPYLWPKGRAVRDLPLSPPLLPGASR